MLRRAFLMATALSMVGALSGLADEQEAKAPELKQILVENGFTGDVTDVKKLPQEFRLVAEQLGHEGATYQIAGEQLKIGVHLAEYRPGFPLEDLQWRSDCPNNSQFHVETILTDRDAALKATTLAWTRARHNAPDAPVNYHSVSNVANKKKNHDVSLDLRKVSRLDRVQLE